MRELITAPAAAAPSPYGLLAAAAVTEDTGSHWRAGVEWQTACPAPAGTTYEPCFAVGLAATGGPPPAKAATADLAVYGATAFTVYAEIDCSTPGFWDDAEARATAALAAAEAYQAEHVFWTGTVAGVADVALPHLAAPAEVTDRGTVMQQATTTVTADALTPAGVLGALEQALAECTQGATGMIHVPMHLVPVLAGAQLLTVSGQRLRTHNGNTVVAGAGYPGTGPDGTGAGWIYATGPVWGKRSPIRVMPQASTLDRTTNTVRALAERTYLLAYDCCLLAAEIPLT